MSLLNVVNLDIVPLQAVDCVKDWDYFSGFVIQTIVPLLSECKCCQRPVFGLIALLQ